MKMINRFFLILKLFILCLFLSMFTISCSQNDKQHSQEQKKRVLSKAIKESIGLQGQWLLYKTYLDGIPFNPFNPHTCIFTTNEMKIKSKDGVSEFLYIIDSTQTPKEIDICDSSSNESNCKNCIYLLDKDFLNLCCSKEGEPRPTEFEALEGQKRTYNIYKRIK